MAEAWPNKWLLYYDSLYYNEADETSLEVNLELAADLVCLSPVVQCELKTLLLCSVTSRLFGKYIGSFQELLSPVTCSVIGESAKHICVSLSVNGWGRLLGRR